MFDAFSSLNFFQILAFLWSSIFFIPPRWIRNGGLWYVQIIITEWIFLSFFLSFVLMLIDFKTVWFIFVIVYYIQKRTYLLKSNSISNDFQESLFERIKNSLLHNIWPIVITPNHTDLKVQFVNRSETHLKFPIVSPKKIIIHIHGGAWKYGDANQLVFISKFFKQLDCEVISINYLKYPDHNLSDILKSVEETFSSLCLGYDPDQKFILYGRSAGAQMSLMLGTKFTDKIERIIALYPVTDFPSLLKRASHHDILKTVSWVHQIMGDTADLNSIMKQLSPTEHLTNPMPKILLVHGENDPVVPVQQSDMLYEKLLKINAPVSYLRMSHCTHGFDAFWNGVSMSLFKKVLLRFLKD